MNPLLFLHFSSAGKGPFMTWRRSGGGGGVWRFRIHGGIYFQASCQPMDQKVFYTPQNKEFYE